VEIRVPIPREETKTPVGVDRVNIFGYHKLPVLNPKLRGALLKKAFLKPMRMKVYVDPHGSIID